MFPLSLLTLAVGLIACGDAASDAESAEQDNRQTDNQMENLRTESAAAPNAGQATAQALPPQTGQYRLLGIVDPNFNNMVAYALKVPRGWQAGQASNDRQHEVYVDNVVRNETKFENPNTGERVKLDNRYDHAYADNNGNYYQSNTPVRASDVNWQELGKVSLSDY